MRVQGNDPDEICAQFGLDRNLPIELVASEFMNEEPNKYDLVIIIGSLEHCQDPNIVLENVGNH